MRASSGSAAPGLGYQRDITETLRRALEINDYRAEAVLEVKGWYTRY